MAKDYIPTVRIEVNKGNSATHEITEDIGGLTIVNAGNSAIDVYFREADDSFNDTPITLRANSLPLSLSGNMDGIMVKSRRGKAIADIIKLPMDSSNNTGNSSSTNTNSEVLWIPCEKVMESTEERPIFSYNLSTYPFPSIPEPMYAVSTSLSDNGDIMVEGLDANYEKVTHITRLSGTTSVLVGTMIRVNRVVNIGGSLNGIVRIHRQDSTTTVFSECKKDINTSHSSIFTVPAGKKGTIRNLVLNFLDEVSLAEGNDIQVRGYVANLLPSGWRGQPMRIFSLGISEPSRNTVIPFTAMQPISEKADIYFTISSSTSSGSPRVFLGYTLELE